MESNRLLNQGGLSARFLWNCNFSLLKDVFNLINLNEPKFKKMMLEELLPCILVIEESHSKSLQKTSRGPFQLKHRH